MREKLNVARSRFPNGSVRGGRERIYGGQVGRSQSGMRGQGRFHKLAKRMLSAEKYLEGAQL